MRRKAKSGASSSGTPCYRVKIAVPGASVFYVLSATKPVVHVEGGVIASVEMAPIEGTEHGDTLAFIRWSDVAALAWRPARIPAGAERQGDAGEPRE
jgi:hypothetical protein